MAPLWIPRRPDPPRQIRKNARSKCGLEGAATWETSKDALDLAMRQQRGWGKAEEVLSPQANPTGKTLGRLHGD